MGLLLAGCTTITNLTPKQEHRNDNGSYNVDAALSTRQQTMRWDSIKPSVVVGKEVYPMHLTHLMTNRWETLVPVGPNENVIYYQLKFDYSYNAFGSAPKSDSMLSQKYRLQIVPR